VGANVTPVSLPIESRLFATFPSPSYTDAYSIDLPDGTSKDPEVLASFIFSEPPAWHRGLMSLRDRLVSPFGLKTASQLTAPSAENAADRVALFKVYSKTSTEIVLGEDDKHLDFRLSLLYRDSTSPFVNPRLILSTVVQCHNLWGRAYLLAIGAFHRLIVQTSLSHAAGRGWPREKLALPTHR
jgi:hypothetical protein